MRKFAKVGIEPPEDESPFQKRQIEGGAVVGHQGTGAGKPLPYSVQRSCLIGEIREKVLIDDKFPIQVLSNRNEERDGAGPAGQAGGLAVNKKTIAK